MLVMTVSLLAALVLLCVPALAEDFDQAALEQLLVQLLLRKVRLTRLLLTQLLQLQVSMDLQLTS